MSVTDPNSMQTRPGSVVVIQWLAYLQGGLAILAGILFLAFLDNDELRADLSRNQIVIAAIVAIAIGVITLWVATSFARGSQLAWVIVACVTLLHLGSAIAWLFWHPAHLIVGLIDIAIAFIIFYLAVLSPETREYFVRYGR